MDIYILRDGEQIGPFSEETTHQMLKQGVVLIDDSAWRPGMPEWIPLQSLLHPESVDLAASAPAEELAMNSSTVDPSPTPAAQQPNKEDRAERFFELSQTEGAEALTGVTKAHCLVLVGYLDAKFPNWDTGKESEAAWNYFFPAVAEKFPQFVRSGWKEKLNYPPAQKKSAPDKKRQVPARTATSSSAKSKTASPAASFFKGFVFGSLIVAASVGGIYVYRHPDALGKAKAQLAALTAKAPETTEASGKKSEESAETEAQKKQESSSSTASAEKQPLTSPAPAASPAGGKGTQPAISATATAMAGANQPEPGMDNVPAPDLPESAPASSNSGMALFDPSAGSPTPGNATSNELGTATGQPQAKTSVTLMQPLELQSRYGKIKIPAGTQLPILEQEGTNLKVRFQNQVVSVPANVTDLGEGGLPR